jgi:hypothetical protein
VIPIGAIELAIDHLAQRIPGAHRARIPRRDRTWSPGPASTTPRASRLPTRAGWQSTSPSTALLAARKYQHQVRREWLTTELARTAPPAAGRSYEEDRPGSRAAGMAMAFKLIESAQQRWRAVNAPHLVALVRAGARFENGKLVERPDDQGVDQQAA